jgi:hypothetical protein
LITGYPIWHNYLHLLQLVSMQKQTFP